MGKELSKKDSGKVIRAVCKAFPTREDSDFVKRVREALFIEPKKSYNLKEVILERIQRENIEKRLIKSTEEIATEYNISELEARIIHDNVVGYRNSMLKKLDECGFCYERLNKGPLADQTLIVPHLDMREYLFRFFEQLKPLFESNPYYLVIQRDFKWNKKEYHNVIVLKSLEHIMQNENKSIYVPLGKAEIERGIPYVNLKKRKMHQLKCSYGDTQIRLNKHISKSQRITGLIKLKIEQQAQNSHFYYSPKWMR